MQGSRDPQDALGSFLYLPQKVLSIHFITREPFVLFGFRTCLLQAGFFLMESKKLSRNHFYLAYSEGLTLKYFVKALLKCDGLL